MNRFHFWRLCSSKRFSFWVARDFSWYRCHVDMSWALYWYKYSSLWSERSVGSVWKHVQTTHSVSWRVLSCYSVASYRCWCCSWASLSLWFPCSYHSPMQWEGCLGRYRWCLLYVIFLLLMELVAPTLSCPQSIAYGVTWPETEGGQRVTAACPAGYKGSLSRFCTTQGVWENVVDSCLAMTCASKTESGYQWPETKINTEVSLPCTGDMVTGVVTRICDNNQNWGVIKSNCHCMTLLNEWNA